MTGFYMNGEATTLTHQHSGFIRCDLRGWLQAAIDSERGEDWIQETCRSHGTPLDGVCQVEFTGSGVASMDAADCDLVMGRGRWDMLREAA